MATAARLLMLVLVLSLCTGATAGPKKKQDKGNAPMVEEETPRPKRARRGTGVLLPDLKGPLNSFRLTEGNP